MPSATKQDTPPIRIYRMVHIDNIPHIMAHGITHETSPNANPAYVPIGDSRLISKRSQQELPNGKKLGDYIPFYFGPRMPMLFTIQKGYNGVPVTDPADIVYCVSDVQRVQELGRTFLCTDGHASDGITSFFDEQVPGTVIAAVDFEAVREIYWADKEDPDLKRRKQAEFLVDGDLPPAAIAGYVVYHETGKQRLLTMGIEENQIAIRPDFYF